MHAQQSLNFADLHLSCQEPLLVGLRELCPGCLRERGPYCQDCCKILVEGAPSIKLPVLVDILQHGETNSKGTGVHAALLAPSHVRLFRHASGTAHHRKQSRDSLQVPDYDEDTVVLFPESKSTPVVGHCQPFKRIVVLDGNWRKARHMLSHPKLQGLRRVQLPTHLRTSFWRRGDATYKGALDEGVCTIEAIYWLCRVLDPGGSYDDLLWFYSHTRDLIIALGSIRARTVIDRLSGGQV